MRAYATRALPLLCIVCLLCGMLFCGAARAAEQFQPGFKTIGVWLAQDNLRLDINIWYPSVRRPSDVVYAPWELRVARNGREIEGRFPLLLLSHDSSETRFSHHETAAMLARYGFVVAALTHSGDNANAMQSLFTLRQLQDRVRQGKAALDVLLHHPDISASIDPSRIGVLGFGVGGTTALMLGGALPTANGWLNYCEQTTEGDPYCTPWARPRMEQFVHALPLKESPADTRIKAVAAVAPAYGMLFGPESLRYLYPPTLIVKAGADSINRAPLHADALHAAKPEAAFAVIEGAESSTLMSACPPSMRKDIPELCGNASPAQRRRAHKQLQTQLGQFFLKNLGQTDNLPQIPPPPQLSPPELPGPPKPQPVAPKKKGRSK